MNEISVRFAALLMSPLFIFASSVEAEDPGGAMPGMAMYAPPPPTDPASLMLSDPQSVDYMNYMTSFMDMEPEPTEIVEIEDYVNDLAIEEIVTSFDEHNHSDLPSESYSGEMMNDQGMNSINFGMYINTDSRGNKIYSVPYTVKVDVSGLKFEDPGMTKIEYVFKMGLGAATRPLVIKITERSLVGVHKVKRAVAALEIKENLVGHNTGYFVEAEIKGRVIVTLKKVNSKGRVIEKNVFTIPIKGTGDMSINPKTDGSKTLDVKLETVK